MDDGFDVVIAGAGIVGLAHAWAARQRGLTVAVFERDHRCVGASIRNFGFITVTGQQRGRTWQRARFSRDVWARLAPKAGIPVIHAGLWLVAREAPSWPVLQAFLATEMGQACTLHEPAEAGARAPWLRTEGAAGALYSPHELRVESREAVPRLAAWLAESQGVRFFWGEQVMQADGRGVQTARRRLRAQHVVLCPGTELQGVAEPFLRPYRLQLSRLQMLRVRPRSALAMGSAVMSDLSLVRYAGYAELPEARALADHLAATEAGSLAHGIHLIAVQSADGTLVVGDSHHNEASPDPFASEAVDQLILHQLRRTVTIGTFDVTERWTGVYPTGAGTDALLLRPEPGLSVVVVTSGTGASTAFGLAEDTFSEA